MNVKYQIKQVLPKIFAVVIKDKYDRAMTFCRAQEYYECPNPKFRGKNFNIWDYAKWYHTKYGKGFSYGADWSGFNMPFDVLRDCYLYQELETPYDYTADDIRVKIEIILYKDNTPYETNAYVIACGSTKSDTFKHELCHAKYYTNAEYREIMSAAIKLIKPEHYKQFKKNIMAMGYAAKVVDDEIQAYLQYGHDDIDFKQFVPSKEVKKYHLLFTEMAGKLCRPVVLNRP